MDSSKSSSPLSRNEVDEEMEVGDCSDEAEEEEDEDEENEEQNENEEDEEDVVMAENSAPPSSGPALSPTVTYEGLASPLRLHNTTSGKPLSLHRGRGRPRKDASSTANSGKPKKLGLKLKRWKSGMYVPSRDPPVRRDSNDTLNTSIDSCTSDLTVTPDGVESSNLDEKNDRTPIDDRITLFQEKWPGKVCSLCNLGERSQLGQGELMKLSIPEGFVIPQKDLSKTTNGFMSPPSDISDAAPFSQLGDKSPRSSNPAVTFRRQKSWAKAKNAASKNQFEPVEELSIVGYNDEPDPATFFDSGVFYVHQSCALWSEGVTRNADLQLENVGNALVQSASRKCSGCLHYGASVACSFTNCFKFFHFPCAIAAGGFLQTKTLTLVCSLHLDQVPLLSNVEVTCGTCYSLGDVSNLLMCTVCGNHYHGLCVGLALQPGTRAGWQCSECRVCQVCRQPEEATKVMLCETCDKAYHPTCLRPIVTSVPKFGWKCKACRLCSDCGSRTPGGGQSSRWHAHYTVCDSCYQQRNKGFSCPLCRKAYRAAAHREMVQCSKCHKFVHGTCDTDADLKAHQQRKESNPDYEYTCPICKNGQISAKRNSIEDSMMDSNLSASQESLYEDEYEFVYDKNGRDPDEIRGSTAAVGLGKGKPYCASKIAKKKLGFMTMGSNSGALRPKGIGKMTSIMAAVTSSLQKKNQRISDFRSKRGPKAKMRGIFGVPGVGLQRPSADANQNKSEDDPLGENRLVLCSAKDKFVLTQDICVMCGALGTDQEGCLIACAQCGQCYHPYCLNVKVTKTILTKGWRCLDCTVCEGCGQRNDEGRLILCDDCDISYHIYCMDPPLEYVPRGTWKCKWCAQCLTCGATDPGFNCMWLRSYTECGPCASRTCCPSCFDPYCDDQLIIKCFQCERWLHASCDRINTEQDAEMCSLAGYTCILCRPRDVPPPHLVPKPKLPEKKPAKPRPPTPVKSPDPVVVEVQQEYLMDGVYLSKSGINQMRSHSLMDQSLLPPQRKKRAMPKKLLYDKDASIFATIESVVSGGIAGVKPADFEGLIPSKMEVDEFPNKDVPATEIYKEGMVVQPGPDGKPPEPPEGFTIFTTEAGVMVLRRKRVRNLNRLGIGGFNANKS